MKELPKINERWMYSCKGYIQIVEITSNDYSEIDTRTTLSQKKYIREQLFPYSYNAKQLVIISIRPNKKQLEEIFLIGQELNKIGQYNVGGKNWKKLPNQNKPKEK